FPGAGRAAAGGVASDAVVILHRWHLPPSWNRPPGTLSFRPKGEICFCSVGWNISPFGRNDRMGEVFCPIPQERIDQPPLLWSASPFGRNDRVNGDPGVSRKPPLQH